MKTRPLVICLSLLAALGLAASASAASAKSPKAKACGQAIIDDWWDGHIDGRYAIHCYRDAIQRLPNDLRGYSSARDDILAAMQQRVTEQKRAEKARARQKAIQKAKQKAAAVRKANEARKSQTPSSQKPTSQRPSSQKPTGQKPSSQKPSSQKPNTIQKRNNQKRNNPPAQSQGDDNQTNVIVIPSKPNSNGPKGPTSATVKPPPTATRNPKSRSPQPTAPVHPGLRSDVTAPSKQPVARPPSKGRTTGPGPVNQVTHGTLGADSPTSIPIPLIVLAALAGVLMLAGIGGFLTRRLKAGRLTVQPQPIRSAHPQRR